MLLEKKFCKISAQYMTRISFAHVVVCWLAMVEPLEKVLSKRTLMKVYISFCRWCLDSQELFENIIKYRRQKKLE